MSKPLYFDYSATTPLDPRVLESMLPYLREEFGNSSSQNAYGWEAEKAVQKARQQAAEAIGCRPQEIFFTSGSTESNNWALRGLADSFRQENSAPIHILSTAVEHSSVRMSLDNMQAHAGVQVEYIPTSRDGRVDVEDIRKRIRPTTRIFSFMWVNNELGSVNPMAEIAALAREHSIYFHTDATQAVGKLPVDIKKIPVDLLSLSAHKIYGPKGVGLLFVRSQNPRVSIAPLFYGGGQERDLRSGTVNVPGVVGLGHALSLVKNSVQEEMDKAWRSRRQLLAAWSKAGLPFRLNGPAEQTAPQILNLTFPPAGAGTIQLPGVAFSRGSACHADSLEESHVLQSIGLNAGEAENSIRLSFGRPTTPEDFLALTRLLFSKFKIDSEINSL